MKICSAKNGKGGKCSRNISHYPPWKPQSVLFTLHLCQFVSRFASERSRIPMFPGLHSFILEPRFDSRSKIVYLWMLSPPVGLMVFLLARNKNKFSVACCTNGGIISFSFQPTEKSVVFNSKEKGMSHKNIAGKPARWATGFDFQLSHTHNFFLHTLYS